MRKPLVVALILLLAVGLAAVIGNIISSNNGPSGNGSVPGASTIPTPNMSTPRGQAQGNPFGVLIPSRTLSISQQIQIANQLGARYIRPTYPIFAQDPTLQCTGCREFTDAGFKLDLTVRNSPNATQQFLSGQGFPASTPPADLHAYQNTIAQIINLYHPQLLVIENEENVPNHFSGTPEQYGEMLKAACEVARRLQTKCTNGGLLSEAVTYLVYESYLQSGQSDKAQSFADRAFADFQKRALARPNGQQDALMRAQRAAPFIEAYKASGADYVNFHWYVDDPQALEEAKAYMEGVTGLPVVINEIGQRDTDPSTTARMLQEVVDLQIPNVIWYMTDGLLVKGLIDANGSLRPTGAAFQDFVTSRFG